LEPLELGDPLGQGQLAALEAGLDRVAGPLALHAPAGGLASPAADPPAHPPARAGGSGGWLQIVDLHLLAPRLLSWPLPPASPGGAGATDTRCGTRAIMPRISGRSGSTVRCPMRRSPRARSVPRCLGLLPMADRTWVTTSAVGASLLGLGVRGGMGQAT